MKRSGTSLEEEIEKLQIECRNVNDQNERLQKDIADITEQYKTLSASIENMNKS
jgi:predicted  nucleic acid-binding Zn-ribbon protein